MENCLHITKDKNNINSDYIQTIKTDTNFELE